jgi:fused signal recognition particle receptor
MEIKELIKEALVEILGEETQNLDIEPSPAVIMVIGVNGVGKTTSIGKISYNLKSQGKKVMLAAADTFRAAAIDQLEIWAKRAGVDIIRQQEGSDPAAVVYDAIQAAKARKVDVLICDTAGRLHTKKNLMEELRKVSRIIDREMPGAKRENLLVLDATTGQNAVSQARTFSEVTDISGIVLTKLDGTAKGGIIIAIRSELGLPVKLVGVGEQMDDLQPFNAKEFVEALFS